jgi:hypothetical protein
VAVTIVASLVSAGSPQPVQIVVNGIPTGTAYTVVGSTGDGSTWPVPGGDGVSAGSQIVLVDNRSALSTPVTYVLTAAGATYPSNVVTVAFPDKYVIQSLDGQESVQFVWRDNGLPGEPTFASVTFDVPGRERPPARFVPGGDGGGELEIRTDRENTTRLLALLKTGRPLVVRTDGAVRDFPAVDMVLPVSGPNSLWPAVTANGPSTDRVWTIRYLLVDDPEPSVALAAFTWDDFDAAMATRTWADFDALFAPLTWDAFDTYDWDQLL